MQEAQSRPQEDELPRNRGQYQGKPLPLDGLLKPEWLHVDSSRLTLTSATLATSARDLHPREVPDLLSPWVLTMGLPWKATKVPCGPGPPHLPGPANSSTSSRKVRVPTNLT